jgi:hypothetical protein
LGGLVFEPTLLIHHLGVVEADTSVRVGPQSPLLLYPRVLLLFRLPPHFVQGLYRLTPLLLQGLFHQQGAVAAGQSKRLLLLFPHDVEQGLLRLPLLNHQQGLVAADQLRRAVPLSPLLLLFPRLLLLFPHDVEQGLLCLPLLHHQQGLVAADQSRRAVPLSPLLLLFPRLLLLFPRLLLLLLLFRFCPFF